MKRAILLLMAVVFACSSEDTMKTIEFWQFWTDPAAKPVIESIVKQFEKENPGWKVNVTDLTWSDGHQKIVVAFGADNPPDLLELGSDWITEFAAGNVLAEIEIDTSRYYLTEPGIFENKIYAQPWFLASRIFYFNKSLLEQANIGMPGEWQELQDACRRISELSDDISGFGANSAEPHRLYKKFLPFVWSSDADIIQDGKIILDSPGVIKALEFYEKLVQCGQIETQRHLEDAFCEGKIGFLISGGWLYKRLKNNPPDFDYQLALMIPERKKSPGWSFAGGEYLVIPQKTKSKQAARKLLDVIVRNENIAALCDSVGFGYPASKEIFSKSKSSGENILYEQLKYSRSTPVHPRWIYIETIIEEMVEQVMLKQMSPRQAAKNAQTKIDKTIRD